MSVIGLLGLCGIAGATGATAMALWVIPGMKTGVMGAP
jgi:hypothetical protein